MKTQACLTAVVGISLLWGTGCQTLLQQRRSQQVQQYSDLEALKRDVAQLKEQVHELSLSRQQVYDRVEKDRSESGATVSQLNVRVDALESGLKTLESRQEQQKREIVDSLSKKMGEVMAAQAQAAPSTPYVQGREHKVEEGQTLSEIARAYGVKMSVIQKANNLKDPNALRVGQVLFIPE